uniref:Uncharacterized protein n=1 Tax=Aureoumbra lagunensis TaxID=44058 RepID=A0A7S3NMF6_9STRA
MSGDIQKVYAFRDAILKGAEEKQKITNKSQLVELFLKSAVDVDSSLSEDTVPLRLLPVNEFEALLISLDIDPREENVVWITSHFKMIHKPNETNQQAITYADPLGLLTYLQLTPETEEESILANLSDVLCDGAVRIDIQTKEELCALITNHQKCLDKDRITLNKQNLKNEAKLLAKCCALLDDDDDDDDDKALFMNADSILASEFWSALKMLNPQLDPIHSDNIAQLIEANYTNDDGTIDAMHLLHDLKLWPGVLEQEHWNIMADTFRDLLINAAQEHGLNTKEALCTLFADEEGRPQKMPLEHFLNICQDQLGLVLSVQDPPIKKEEEQQNNEELISFLRCFLDDQNNIDLGDLLWKIMLWPGAEEEHRALLVGRNLRQDLIIEAEKRGLETMDDLWTHLIAHAGDGDTRYLPLDRVIQVLHSDFAVPESSDLNLYLQHFVEQEEDDDASAQSTKKRLDLQKLLTHLELFTQDEDDFAPESTNEAAVLAAALRENMHIQEDSIHSV